MVKIEIELADKLEKPLEEILKSLKEVNKGVEVTKEKALAEVCKQYIAQEYAKLLMRD